MSNGLLRATLVTALIATGQVGAAPAVTDDAATTKPAKVDTPKTDASKTAKPFPIYVPPDPGAPKTRIAGTTRSRADLPEIQVLAPDHTGLTTSEQPTLWWWLSAPTDERIDLTLNDPKVIEPLLEVTLPGPFRAGYHAVQLADHDVRLEEGKEYDFFVLIVPDPERRSGDVVAGSAIRRVSPRGEIGKALALADAGQRAQALAREGIWFEAIDEFSMAAAAGDARAKEMRRAILAAAGLEFERAQSASTP